MAGNSKAVPDDFGNCRGSFAALAVLRRRAQRPATKAELQSNVIKFLKKQRCIPAFEDDAKQRVW